MDDKQTEQDFEHIGDSQTVEKRTDVTVPSTSHDEKLGAPTKDETTPETPTSTVAPQSKKTVNFNKYFLYTLVAGLVISALISITAVLIGEFNSTMSRALGTTGSMVAHTLIALLLVLANSKRSKGSSLVLNTLLLITIASFITSLFGIWDVISGRIVGDLYLVYFYAFAAVLWVQLLLEVGSNLLDKATHITSQVGIGLTALFYVLIAPTAFINYPDKVAEFHLRAIAASAIALATASVLATVFHRIYVFKHPEVRSLPSTKSGWDIVMAVIVLLFGLPIIFMLIASLTAFHNADTYHSSSSSTSTLESPTPQSPRPDSHLAQDQDQSSALDCSREPGFEKPTPVQTGGIYTYKSIDTEKNTLYVAYPNTNASVAPILYDGTLRAYDANCTPIDINRLESGDSIQIYLKTGYSDFFNNAVAFIQKTE